jgi:hypothetical protein
MGRIEELEAMAHRVAAMRRADRRKGAHVRRALAGRDQLGHMFDEQTMLEALACCSHPVNADFLMR